MMEKKYDIKNTAFDKTAIYRIVFEGNIEGHLVEQRWGLQVTVEKTSDNKAISILVGRIDDQSQLSGILQLLYDKHYTLISVNMMTDVES